MTENGAQPMRSFDELNSQEQAEKIAQVRAWLAELLDERVRAALGLDAAARAQEMWQAHCRYRWTSDQVPHNRGQGSQP